MGHKAFPFRAPWSLPKPCECYPSTLGPRTQNPSYSGTIRPLWRGVLPSCGLSIHYTICYLALNSSLIQYHQVYLNRSIILIFIPINIHIHMLIKYSRPGQRVQLCSYLENHMSFSSTSRNRDNKHPPQSDLFHLGPI